MKRALLGLMTSRPLVRLFAPLTDGRVSIFMLHRFEDPRHGVAGHSGEQVRETLVHLLQAGYAVLPLREAFRRLLGEGPPLRRAVAFTMDDGYRDQAEAAEVFAELGCPVTIFLTSGFVDGRLWFWWDQLEYALARTPKRRLELSFDGTSIRRAWSGDAERAAALDEVTAACKRVDDEARLALVQATAAALDVSLPAAAPEAYAPMSWDRARALEGRGVSFGPHTMTHPILSRVRDDARAAHEIEGSWRRLQAELRDPVPIFCYPNGQATDFGEREIACLRGLGLEGAVVGQDDYADAREARSDAGARYRVKRFSYPPSRRRLVQYTSGVERLKQLLRGSG